MRFDELTPAHVRRAVDLYLRLAWPPDQRAPGREPPIAVADLEDARTLEELFERFEQRSEEQQSGLRHYALRLGNVRYPFMKLVVHEYLVNEELFFSVDTHDNLEVRPTAPDYAAWVELKRWNRALKDEIERAWAAAGLPTHVDLRQLALELAHVEGESVRRGRLLLVDDEQDVAHCVQALLASQGYEVEMAHTGERVLERLERDPLPDLVVLDYEMPGVDGLEVLTRIRAAERTRDLPVLMATAAGIDLADLPRASGFLRKPYPRELLYRMIAELLERRKPAARPQD